MAADAAIFFAQFASCVAENSPLFQAGLFKSVGQVTWFDRKLGAQTVILLIGFDDILDDADLLSGQAGDVQHGAAATPQDLVHTGVEQAGDSDKHLIGRHSGVVFIGGDR